MQVLGKSTIDRRVHKIWACHIASGTTTYLIASLVNIFTKQSVTRSCHSFDVLLFCYVTSLTCHSFVISLSWCVTLLLCHSCDVSLFCYITSLRCHSFCYVTSLRCRSFLMSLLWDVTLLLCHSFDVSLFRYVTPLIGAGGHGMCYRRSDSDVEIYNNVSLDTLMGRPLKGKPRAGKEDIINKWAGIDEMRQTRTVETDLILEG